LTTALGHERDEPVRDSQGRTRDDSTVTWDDESKYGKSIQIILAGSWVLLLSSLPFIMPIINREMPSKTQMTIAGLMLVTIWGGFLLFTNIILFQSIHFERIRPLTTIECTYFMAQVITTVGYGDITPAKPRGQVFVGLYVLGALFIIAMVISDLTSHLVEKLESRKAVHSQKTTLASLLAPHKPTLQPLLSALAVFAFFDICWVMFFWLHPREGKTLFQCVYMSIITLSTVGFGWFTPVTEEGMIFGSFWMLFGSGALVNVISQFTTLCVQYNEYEKFKPENYKGALTSLKGQAQSTETVTESEFLRFALLHTNALPSHVIEDVLDAWHNLKPSKDGTITVKAVEKQLKDEYEMMGMDAK